MNAAQERASVISAIAAALLSAQISASFLIPPTAQSPTLADEPSKHVQSRPPTDAYLSQIGGFAALKADTVPTENIRAQFESLAEVWKSDRMPTSSSTDLCMHRAYQEIIGLGKDALPLIFAELQKELDFWFWALAAISRENPVPPEDRGNMEEMAKIWLEWGRSHGCV